MMTRNVRIVFGPVTARGYQCIRMDWQVPRQS
jgi:hypothetical protein